MYGYNVAGAPGPDSQQQQPPWAGNAGWINGVGMDGAAMGAPGSYSPYAVVNGQTGGCGTVSNGYQQQPQMHAQMQPQMQQQMQPQMQPVMQPHMQPEMQQQMQPRAQDKLQQFQVGQNYGGAQQQGFAGGNGFAAGRSGNWNGSFRGDFQSAQQGGGFGNDSFGGGGYSSGNFEGGDYDSYFPRYGRGSGPEYAQNNLSRTTVEDGLDVTHYGEVGEQIPKSVDSWEEAAAIFPPQFIQQVHKAGFEKPMPIQANTWGIGVQGRDLIGIAKTGSGKTLAYLFLGFVRITGRRCNSPMMLVLAPTRELAQQIEQECNKFGYPIRIRTACCYGGAPRGPQLGQLRRGAQVVVATPGRLNDFLSAGQIQLSQCCFLVLDEADRMLDLGFEPQIRTIISALPTPHQTLLYSATWPKELRSLASDFLTKPIHVHIGRGDNALSANKDISQEVIIVPNETDKMEHLRNILQQCVQGDRVLIFCETKAATASLSEQLTQTEQIFTVPIHGDLSQRDRDWALGQFKSGRAPIMVATDVAGRGLDIKGIAVVVNWDAAHNAEDYVHRIGRTARAGEKGVAYTFLTPSDNRKARDIVTVMENTGIAPAPELLQLAGRGVRNGGFRKGKGKGKGGKGGKGKFGGFGGKGKGSKGKGNSGGGGGFGHNSFGM